MYLVSACLVGIRSRYDGGDALSEELIRRLRGADYMPVCPEELGGLTTPRAASELVGGDGHDVLAGRARVINIQGEDVTAAFLAGAREVLRLARRLDVEACFLKSGSPSCGLACSDGPGPGIVAALLQEEGIRVKEF